MNNKDRLIYIKEKFDIEIENVKEYINLISNLDGNLKNWDLGFHIENLKKNEILSQDYEYESLKDAFVNDRKK